MGAEHRHFVLVVAGDNHEDLIKKYSSAEKVVPYLVYRFSDAEKLYNNYIETLKKMKNITVAGNSDEWKEMIDGEIEYYTSIDYVEYYTELTAGLDIDEKTGDAYSANNPDGKYDAISRGGAFSLPLINKNGEETYSERKGNVDWGKIHLTTPDMYAAAWDMVMGDKKPETEDEKTIYENMKNRTSYFKAYGTRDNYIKSNTSFWGYAFLSEETGWVELEQNVNQFVWVTEFFDRFIKPLDDNTLITIYECLRN